jgi:hypothetical protein
MKRGRPKKVPYLGPVAIRASKPLDPGKGSVPDRDPGCCPDPGFSGTS